MCASRPGRRGPAYLVLYDKYYPGWHARVNGRKAPLYRANYLFRAVPVPEGEHTVEFHYQPASVAGGALLTLLTGIGACAGAVGFLLPACPSTGLRLRGMGRKS